MERTPSSTTGFPTRRIELGRGRTLTVREAGPDDVDRLAALFDGLDLDARYRRFFCAYRPRREFLERMVAVGARGGLLLVAEAGPDGSPTELVAEAGYEPLPDGDGELAVTVAAGWRGWLGPYLVDAVCEVAAARGVPNLEADVLAANGPMLALLRHRGCVVMERADWSVVRLLIGTGAAPSWPAGADVPCVLVEGAAGHLQTGEAARTGRVRVIACPGPGDATGRRGRPCPALAGTPCPLAAGADLVVLAPSDDDDRWAALDAAHRTVHPGVPVCVVRPGMPVATAGGEPLAGVDAHDVVGLLQRAVAPRGADRGGSS